MPPRILISPDGMKVSKPGFDVNTASDENLAMFPNMGVMVQSYRNTVTLPAGGAQDFGFNNPSGKLPYIVLASAGGDQPDRETYCAEISPPYNVVRIRNINGPTRSIRFVVLISNS